MKKIALVFSIVLATAFAALQKAASQDAASPQSSQPATAKVEYASVRFMEERTSIVWPDGTVDNVLALAKNTKFTNTTEKYPKGTDYRMYWLTVAMNIMAQRGFELAHMHEADVVMKRQIGK